MLLLMLACSRDAALEPNCPADPGSGSPTASGSGTGGGSTPSGGVWPPAPCTTWQWQLTGTIDTSVEVEVYDIDLFEAPQEAIDQLHADGRTVICYFSAGSYEDWRPDAEQFPAAAIGRPLDDWPGEWWVDPRSAEVRQIMEDRLDLAVDKQCDAVEPDNVEAWAAESGFPDLTRADQLDYNRFLAEQAHARGLSIGLKNVVELVDELVDDFDWSLDEECLAYDECRGLRPFLDQGKAVFHVEYVNRASQGEDLAARVCGDPTLEGFSTLIKTWDLGAWQIACP
jgi:hypothetical protein